MGKQIMVLKVQRPLATTEEEPTALIYNRSRSLMTQIPYTDVEQLFGDGEYKVYVEAIYDDRTEQLHVLERLQEQDF